jgi:PAS domain S-box-containing protein
LYVTFVFRRPVVNHGRERELSKQQRCRLLNEEIISSASTMNQPTNGRGLPDLALCVEQAPAALAMFDTEMRFLAVSRRFLCDMASLLSTTVFAPAEVIGRSIYETFPGMPSRWRESDSRVLAGEELAEEEDFVRCEGNRTEWTRWSMKPWRTTDGRVGGALLFTEIITREAEVRHALADSEERFRATFENAAVGIAHLSPDLRYLRANEASSRIVGWPADEYITKSVPDITHPDDLDNDLWHIEQMREGKIDSYEGEKRYLRKDGSITWARVTTSCVRGRDGSVRYFVRVVQDITREIEARHALADSEERFRATFENAPIGIVHLDPNLRHRRANNAMSGIVRWPLDEFVTKSVNDVTHPDDVANDIAHLEQIRRGKIESYEFEKRYLGKDGSITWARVTTSCVRGHDGSVEYFVRVVQDISDRKHAEEQLRRQAELLDQSHDAIFTWKLGGGITYWSRGAETLYGYSREEAIGRVSHDLLRTRASGHPEDVEAQIALQGSWFGELTHTTRDGREIVVESRHVRVSYDGELYALETNRDITTRKRTEEQVHLLMREANHRAKNLLSLVQAIARQTTASDRDDFIDRFTERLEALAANQDLLVRHKWQGVDIEDLVRAQLAPFADLIGPRIVVGGPQLHLNAAAAQALGLALHELATNAGKYGALSTDAGRVHIGWLLEGDALAVSWTERSGPPVRPPEREGFGTTVMRSMSKRALGGEVQLDYPPTGVQWHLTCPAANALERAVKPTHAPLRA